jgi:putative CRISPR-associated protein (TIGR02619 family)
MVRNVLICTVGTSLKGNLVSTKDRKFTKLLSQANVKGIALELSAIESDNHLAGAEINSITSIIKKGLLKNRTRLYLLLSDTDDGTLIGNILKAYYERHQNPCGFEHVQSKVIKGLSDQSPHLFKTEGLRNLVKAIAIIVRKHGAESVLINATGGYKAQISFAGMIGQALEIPVCYLFEKFSEVIELPPQPISLDLSFWLENASLFFDLAGDGVEKNPTKKDPRFASLVDEIDVEGTKVIGLSATGQLFHEMFQYRFQKQREMLLPPDSSLEPDKKIIKYEDSNDGRHSGLETYLKKLCQVSYVERVYTHYFNPKLPIRNYFRPSAKGNISQVEGGYSDGKSTTKFDVVTTSIKTDQRNAAIVDLTSLFI